MMITISVLIVNYNGATFIPNCLDSLFKSKGNFELDVIVVDNSSTDNSIEVLSLYKSRITLIQNFNNSGFSKGTNIAASFAKGDYYFLLNNDTILYEDTIQNLLDYFLQHDDIGALSPKLCNEDGSVQCPGSILGHWRFKSKTVQDVSFLVGAALLMSKHVYLDIGGLDDNLFFYNEDVDLCKTLLKKKLRLVYYPKSIVIHIGGASTKFRKISSLIEGYRGGFYICRKHYKYAYPLYRFIVLFDVLPRLLIHSILSIFSKKNKDFAKLYFEVLIINFKNEITYCHPKDNVKKLS